MKKILYLLLFLSFNNSILLADDNCACTKVCDVSCCNLIKNDNIYGKTYFTGRSQGHNLARRMAGMEDKMHLYGNECYYAIPNISIEYQHNFDSDKLGKWFSTGNSDITYGYTGDTFDNLFPAKNTVAINTFGFAYTGSGTVSFCPTKSDLVLDLDLYVALDPLLCGTWIRIDVPIVKTSFDIGLNVKETGSPSSVLSGLYNTTNRNINIPAVYKTFREALLGDKKVGDLPTLKYGKICGKRSDTSIANIRLDIGYDWFRRPHWHFASAFDFILPFGTKPNAEFLFEPIVGNQGRFEFGGAYDFRYDLWYNCDNSKNLQFYINGYFNTVLPGKNKRLLGVTLPSEKTATFGNMYYALLKLDNNLNIVGLERAANLLAGTIKIDASFEGAVAFMLQYNCNCLMYALGGEIWGRTNEKIVSRCFDIPENTYTDNVNYGQEGEPTTHPFVSNENINYCPALHPDTYSCKLFGFVGYNWNNCSWKPFALLEGEVEFGHQNRAYSQWGIIGKAGVSF